MTVEERINLFNREISYIFDKDLKIFAQCILENADEYFFNVPASSSGKYHPDFARGNGGLVRHTKAVVYFTNEIIRSELEFGTIDRHTADLMLVSALAHDIKKQGDGSGSHTVKEHPTLAAEYVKNLWEENTNGISEEDIDFICSVIKSHMGPWQEPKPKTRNQLIVYYADFIASRKEISGLTFIEGGDDAELLPATPYTPITVDNYIFDFGKTKGQTIKESYEANPGYIRWIANKEGFGNTEVQNLVKEFLKTI